MSGRTRAGALDTGDILLTTVLVAQAIRLVAGVVGGVVTATDQTPFAPGRFRTGAAIAEFGAAGDGVGIVLLLLAAALLWWRAAGRAPTAGVPRLGRFREATAWLLMLTAVAVVLVIVGLTIEASVDVGAGWRRVVSLQGFQIAYLVAAVGALVVVRGLAFGREDVDDAEGSPAAVFAVDRQTGAVLAWWSIREAADNAPLYGVEDDEYEWYLDDGTVVAASAEDGDVHLVPGDDERPQELIRHLQEHAQRRGLRVDDPDEPLEYVDPITRDHYLQMWPGWMRWIGRLVR